ncbi:MAG: sensor histidine kinase [Alkalispirochaeta sp.]
MKRSLMMNLDTELLGIWHEEIERGIRESRALCLALFSSSEDVLFTNAAMASLLGEPPIASFTNPSFERLAEMETEDVTDPVFSGFVTLTKDSEDTSIFARAYRRNGQVLVIGEIDVTSLSKQYRTVVELNRENNRLQRDLIRQKHTLRQEVEQRKHSETRVQRLLEEKEVILREVHHRIKNNMNLVLSMLRIQDDMNENETTRPILQDAAHRVNSMMLLYDKLYQSSTIGAMELDEYLVPLVKQVLGVFPHGASIQLHTEIAPITLEPKVLSELGIIANELVTNSMKYAFTDRSDGCLTVVARQEGAAVTISIADNGPGLPEKRSDAAQAGFGMTLVNALVDQLDGTIRSENDNGARFIIEFDVKD